MCAAYNSRKECNDLKRKHKGKNQDKDHVLRSARKRPPLLFPKGYQRSTQVYKAFGVAGWCPDLGGQNLANLFFDYLKHVQLEQKKEQPE